MQTRNIFGISGNILHNSQGPFHDSDYAGVCYDYIEAISLAGGTPLILPVVEQKKVVQKQLEAVDVLLITGGSDVNPLLYGEEPSPKLEMVITERDQYELELIKLAVKMNIPIFGICRGLQILNIAFGGTLHQDIGSVAQVAHRQTFKRHEPSHQIKIKPSTLLHKILEKKEVSTNSYHHQAIKKLAPHFTISATATDGVIEAIERTDKNKSPILAVQWHPEMMAIKNPMMLKLFEFFAKL